MCFATEHLPDLLSLRHPAEQDLTALHRAQTGLAAGSYTFTVKDANNCTLYSPCNHYTANCDHGNTAGTNVLCNGASTDSLSLRHPVEQDLITLTPAQTGLAAGSYTLP
jgi:hypothetical protein